MLSDLPEGKSFPLQEVEQMLVQEDVDDEMDEDVDVLYISPGLQKQDSFYENTVDNKITCVK